MVEWIMQEETDMDGVDCYIRKGELIRCKDCKYYEIWEMKSGKDGYTDDKRFKPSVCTYGAFAIHRDKEWFCADAERKETE